MSHFLQVAQDGLVGAKLNRLWVNPDELQQVSSIMHNPQLSKSRIDQVWKLSHRLRGNGETIKREEFDQRKEASEYARHIRLNKKPNKLASHGKNVEDLPLLKVVAQKVCIFTFSYSRLIGYLFFLFGTCRL